ncbi:MAG: hypothetical protein K9N21_19200 [Deltaproteobacteria bacterium]|nr:hypothetical protein [Deltaproteobacteria bacterium]
MIESLGPLVSLFKLFTQGVAESWKAIKSSRDKAIQRKFIEIQLSLEDTIENAERLFVIIERSRDKDEKDNGYLLEEFKSGLYAQIQRLNIFIDQITDRTSGEILKLFAPDLRRKISLLIQSKMSAMFIVLRGMYDIEEKATITKEGITATIQTALLNWNHVKFVAGGESYLRELGQHSKNTSLVLSDHLQEQKKVIEDLIECSNDFSKFLKEHVRLPDAVSVLRKGN